MKKQNFLGLVTVMLLLMSCSSPKNLMENKLYNTTWELEYLSGPRIAFEGLFPDKKPYIAFNKTTSKAEGNNSCNGYAASYTLKGDSISFGEPDPTTMMFCGGGEKFFLNTMRKMNRYSIDAEGKLNLMINKVPMMRFKEVPAK